MCSFVQHPYATPAYAHEMPNLALHEFISVHRTQLIHRCKAKVAARSGPSTSSDSDDGVPLFLDQLVVELRDGPFESDQITEGATRHGHDLLRQGFTVSQVVHDYGDVCQSVTDLAVETNAPISTDDFRTLNRCLDDAIAGAVTQHAAEQEVTRDGDANKARHLLNTAITAFEVLHTGTVAVGGSTGKLLHRSLMGLRAVMSPVDEIASPNVNEQVSLRKDGTLVEASPQMKWR